MTIVRLIVYIDICISNITLVDVRRVGTSAVGNHSVPIYSHISRLRVSYCVYTTVRWHECEYINNWWVYVKCEPKSSQLKEPKT